MDTRFSTPRFSSRQLTAVVIAAVTLALFIAPRPLQANSGSTVNVSDQASTGAGSFAKVLNTRLLGGTCDPFSATNSSTTCGRVFNGRQITALCDESVAAVDPTKCAGVASGGALKVAAPGTHWNQINDIQTSSSTSRAVVFTSLGPARLVLTSMTFSAEGPNAGTVRAFIIVYVSNSSAGNCLDLTGASFGAAERFVVTLQVGSSHTITWPSGLLYSVYAGSGKRFCVDVEGTGPASFVLHTSGAGYTL